VRYVFSVSGRGCVQWGITSDQIVVDFFKEEIGRCFARGSDSKAFSCEGGRHFQ
jgi:hypothetical protein